jgi:hypothetical protein
MGAVKSDVSAFVGKNKVIMHKKNGISSSSAPLHTARHGTKKEPLTPVILTEEEELAKEIHRCATECTSEKAEKDANGYSIIKCKTCIDTPEKAYPKMDFVHSFLTKLCRKKMVAQNGKNWKNGPVGVKQEECEEIGQIYDCFTAKKAENEASERNLPKKEMDTFAAKVKKTCLGRTDIVYPAPTEEVAPEKQAPDAPLADVSTEEVIERGA